MTLAASFFPYSELVRSILELSGTVTNSTDGAHEEGHLLRVWNIVKRIFSDELEADREVLAAATLMHDCVPIEKNDPRRTIASRLSAEKAGEVLRRIGWTDQKIWKTQHAIETHSFSANIEPRTIEGAILRDADRIDALGAVGIARTFYVAGRLGLKLYDPFDPFAQFRPLNDEAFALDHFENKLFKLTDGLRTKVGSRIAHDRVATMRSFLAILTDEVKLAD